ncbi:MAG: Rne/Rng family ribonuclease [Holosporales bacterium]|jgi:ribonuclease E|nr:Rne/Rng family ribonuclease [Holosporales bacterium]
MAKKILINAQDPNETRIAVIDGNQLVDFDSEIVSQKPIRGNIYLARVVRVEPSLQAVFVEYAEGKSGFLPFSEIHTEYYRIPVDDRRDTEENQKKEEETEKQNVNAEASADDIISYPSSVNVENIKVKKNKKHKRRKRTYDIQEVIQNKQVLLIQVIKDERGSKGAAVTTYISLAGQYCVLMPNAGERNGGVSKRIQNDDDRKRLKDLINDLEVPSKMSIIIRTAGQERNKSEIRRDYEYLTRLWDNIRKKTLESSAPELINEEACFLMRSVRDFYKKEIDEVVVDTKDAYKRVRDFMKQLSPSGVKKIKLHKEDEDSASLFNSYDIEQQILNMISPRVELPSGGSIVISQTEALVAIDVNSGRATKERHIDTTALKTNLEAAKEITRQLKLRDLSGLIVIDFIDMSEHKHIQQVERIFRQETANDNARIQIANISQFGLLEMSRQRLRSSVMETYGEICPHCQGRGVTYSKRYFVSTILHILEKIAFENKEKNINLYVPNFIYSDLLNKKRNEFFEIEQKNNCLVNVQADSSLASIDFVIDYGIGVPRQFSLGKMNSDNEEDEGIKETKNKKNNLPPDSNQKSGNKGRRRRRSRGSKSNEQTPGAQTKDEQNEHLVSKQTEEKSWLKKIFNLSMQKINF